MKTVLVFGTFDGLHSGHIYFLKQAKRLTKRGRTSTHSASPARGAERRRFDFVHHDGKLIVAIARDQVVKKLKHRTPHTNEHERLELVSSLQMVNQAVLGDREVSSYKIVRRLKPDIICLGYDQKALAKDLKKRLSDKKVVILKAYKGQKLHTSKLSSLNQQINALTN